MLASWEGCAALQGGAALFFPAAFDIFPLLETVCFSMEVPMAAGTGMGSCACSAPCCKAGLLCSSVCLLGSLLLALFLGLCSAKFLGAVSAAGSLGAMEPAGNLLLARKPAVPAQSP